jgi:hypothetical protein
MSWQTEMVETLYIMVGDWTKTTYSSTNLERVLVVAAQMVASELDFSQDFQSNIDSLDITPDPTDRVNNTRDDSFINLTCIKAACIINRGDAFKNAGDSLKVRDIGGISIDTTEVFKAKFNLLQKGGWCAIYAEEKFDYQLSSTIIAGAAIMSPFRVSAGYCTSVY